MADNHNAGWRGRFGWGESNGTHGMYGPGRFEPYGYGYGAAAPYDDGPGYRRDEHDHRMARPQGRERDDYGYDPYAPYGARRGGEPRSFMPHNDYVEAVTDGADTPGEHRGRGPKGYRRSDERIAEEVNDRLTEDAWLDASGIEVEVKDGEVTLSGEVESRQAKRRAEDIAERASGVVDIHNRIRVDRSRYGQINDQTGASTV